MRGSCRAFFSLICLQALLVSLDHLLEQCVRTTLETFKFTPDTFITFEHNFKAQMMFAQRRYLYAMYEIIHKIAGNDSTIERLETLR